MSQEPPATDGPVEFDELPLKERFPEYLAVFGVFAGIAILVGGLIGAFSSPSVPVGIGYAMMFIGVGFWLVGGLTGSGFNAGGFGGMFTGRQDDDARQWERERESADAAEKRAQDRGMAGGDSGRRGRRRRDPAARMQRRLAAGPNPRAFWTVSGGLAYILLGILIVSLWP